MYFHRQELQHKATPDKPDAVYARKLQEVLGGQDVVIAVAVEVHRHTARSSATGVEERRREAVEVAEGVVGGHGRSPFRSVRTWHPELSF